MTVLDDLASPAAVCALAAVFTLPPLTGFPAWPALARGRVASTLCPSLAAGAFVYLFVSRLTAPAAG